jgi:hypothetical protein
MMTILSIIVIVFLFFFRKKLTAMLIARMKNKKEDTKDVLVRDDGAIFMPIGTVRTFSVTIAIEEQGDGTAKISIAKMKKE